MKKLWTSILFIVIISGCATRKEIINFKGDTYYLREQVELLRGENKEIRKLLREINTSLQILQDENSQIKADLLSELDNLKSQTHILDSKLEDSSYRLSEIFSKTGEEKMNSPVSDSLNDKSNSPHQNTILPEILNDVDPQKLYNTAYMDFSRGNYKLAQQGFQEYIRNFPDTDYAGNAQYWIGETYYATTDYETAFEEFKKVVVNTPRSKKVTAALLKMGFCQINLNNITGAKKQFSAIIQNFPNSEEAKLAKLRLAELN